MKFSPPLEPGLLVKRYKRFLADVQLDSGELITAHCPNTGSMLGCDAPGSRVWLSHSNNPKRKTAYSWELVEVAPDILVGIHTGRANGLVALAIQTGLIASLQGYGIVRSEVSYGAENSRIDFLLQQGNQPDAYVEVKSVTAICGTDAQQNVMAIFPDAVSARGTKHLRELMQMVRAGKRAVLCFCVQRSDARCVRAAQEIDPLYARTLREAVEAGVEVIAYRASVTPEQLRLVAAVPVVV